MSNKMVSCKVCGEQIAKSAKVCPHCGAKRKRHTALGITLTILGVLLIAGAVGSKGGSPAGSDGPQTTDDSVFGVGEPVEMDNIVVTLESVTENSGGNYMTPKFSLYVNSPLTINLSRTLPSVPCFPSTPI